MSKAIKLLVSGFEASGKSTLTAQIKDALIINFDGKEYSLPNTISTDFKEYKGINSVITFINQKMQAYKDKFGDFPKVIVLDTATALYSVMARYNGQNYKNFDIHNQNLVDIETLNKYIDDVLIGNGISVVIVAHSVYDEGKNTFVIPASGKFQQRGSWHSTVNDAIFIDKTNSKRTVYLKSLKYPARTTVYTEDSKEEVSVPMSEYSITEHIEKLLSVKDDKTTIKL